MVYHPRYTVRTLDSMDNLVIDQKKEVIDSVSYFICISLAKNQTHNYTLLLLC